MSIRVTCSGCLTIYDLPDGMRGKKHRCKRCEQMIQVGPPTRSRASEPLEVLPAEEADERKDAIQSKPGRVPPPRQRSASAPASRNPKKPVVQTRSNPTLLILGAALVVMLLFGGVAVLAGVGYWLSNRSPAPAVAGLQGETEAIPGPQPVVNPKPDQQLPPAGNPANPSRPVDLQPQAKPAPLPAGDGPIPAATLAQIKRATVFIKVQTGTLAATGTGFVIQADGETAYVATNSHVVAPVVEDSPIPTRPPFGRPVLPRPPFGMRGGPTTVTLVFDSGTPQERTIRAEIVASEPDRDLAILRVNGVKDLPRPVEIGPLPQLVETMSVYIFGFPFGQALAVDKGNPAITIGKGAVSSIRLNDRGELARVQVEGEVHPGNSGGPVVDAQGRLIGVTVAKVRNTRIGLVIPSNDLR